MSNVLIASFRVVIIVIERTWGQMPEAEHTQFQELTSLSGHNKKIEATLRKKQNVSEEKSRSRALKERSARKFSPWLNQADVPIKSVQ